MSLLQHRCVTLSPRVEAGNGIADEKDERLGGASQIAGRAPGRLLLPGTDCRISRVNGTHIRSQPQRAEFGHIVRAGGWSASIQSAKLLLLRCLTMSALFTLDKGRNGQ